MGIANQHETTVVLNRRSGLVVFNTIVWQERRAEPTKASRRSELSE